MRYLLIPENNSLSHVAKCLRIRAALVNRGHEVLIAANHMHSRFLQKIGVDNHALCDIQEIDGAPLPTTAWFKHPQRVIDCINAEVAFLKNIIRIGFWAYSDLLQKPPPSWPTSRMIHSFAGVCCPIRQKFLVMQKMKAEFIYNKRICKLSSNIRDRS